MILPLLHLPRKVIIRGSSKSIIHTEEKMKKNAGYQLLWKDKTLINYIDKKWRKEYPESYEDENRHRSSLSGARWLCRYGVLYEHALFYLTEIFGLHGIAEEGYIRNAH